MKNYSTFPQTKFPWPHIASFSSVYSKETNQAVMDKLTTKETNQAVLDMQHSIIRFHIDLRRENIMLLSGICATMYHACCCAWGDIQQVGILSFIDNKGNLSKRFSIYLLVGIHSV